MWLPKFRNISLASNRQKVSFDNYPNVSQKRKKLLGIIQKHPTPFFITDQEILLNKLEKLKESLDKYWGNYQIAYSFKTNYEVAKLGIFKKHKCWAEVVSGREYSLAKKLGYKGTQIIFNGPYKNDSELALALKDGALVNIDNFDELERIIRIAKTKRGQWDIGIRINTEIPYVQRSRFGFSINSDEARRAVKRLNDSKNLNLTSIHIHIGTDIDNPLSYQAAASNLCNFIKKDIRNYQARIKLLNFGGGFPAHGLPPFGKKNWNPQPIEKYVKAITEELIQISQNQDVVLILEPGRYLVDDATMFLTRVINGKYSRGKQILTTDATTTMLPLKYYRRQIIKVFNKKLEEKKNLVTNSTIYGASCREDDILYQGPLPKAKRKDYIVYYVTGAYNLSMNSDFIFDEPELFLI